MISISHSALRGLAVAVSGLGLLIACPAVAQIYPPPAPSADSVSRVDRSQEFAVPSVIGMGPSKGLVLHYERVPRFNITSTSKSASLSDYKGEARKNGRFLVKAYAPLLNHPHLKVVLGINYEREEFEFAPPADYELYQNLQDKGLKVLGTQLAVIRPIDDVNYFIFRVKGELNGDYTSSELSLNDYLKMSSEFIYGWKKTPSFSWGLGVQLGYTFGRQSIYPALLYNRTFSERWGVEALFPARVTVRRNLSNKSLLFAGYSVDGLSYNIKLRNPIMNDKGEELKTLELRETEVKGRLRWEREIYDFLWFGLEGGYRYNYSFDAYDRSNNDRNKIIDSKLADAPYASIELFLVPPRKFVKR